jgi:hypothetical protein
VEELKALKIRMKTVSEGQASSDLHYMYHKREMLAELQQVC